MTGHRRAFVIGSWKDRGAGVPEYWRLVGCSGKRNELQDTLEARAGVSSSVRCGPRGHVARG